MFWKNLFFFKVKCVFADILLLQEILFRSVCSNVKNMYFFTTIEKLYTSENISSTFSILCEILSQNVFYMKGCTWRHLVGGEEVKKEYLRFSCFFFFALHCCCKAGGLVYFF